MPPTLRVLHSASKKSHSCSKVSEKGMIIVTHFAPHRASFAQDCNIAVDFRFSPQLVPDPSVINICLYVKDRYTRASVSALPNSFIRLESLVSASELRETGQYPLHVNAFRGDALVDSCTFGVLEISNRMAFPAQTIASSVQKVAGVVTLSHDSPQTPTQPSLQHYKRRRSEQIYPGDDSFQEETPKATTGKTGRSKSKRARLDTPRDSASTVNSGRAHNIPSSPCPSNNTLSKTGPPRLKRSALALSPIALSSKIQNTLATPTNRQKAQREPLNGAPRLNRTAPARVSVCDLDELESLEASESESEDDAYVASDDDKVNRRGPQSPTPDSPTPTRRGVSRLTKEPGLSATPSSTTATKSRTRKDGVERMQMTPKPQNGIFVQLMFTQSLDVLGDYRTWSDAERVMGRRLLRCNRRQEAARIDLSFDIVNPDHVITVEDKHTVFNCLAIPDHLLNPADASNLLSTYISSIELVKLVFLVLRVRDLPFAEKNRLLRAFDAFYPKTVTKTMTDAFGFLTSLPEPKPMKHLRPVRIYDWTALEQMVRKATYRYAYDLEQDQMYEYTTLTATPSSTNSSKSPHRGARWKSASCYSIQPLQISLFDQQPQTPLLAQSRVYAYRAVQRQAPLPPRIAFSPASANQPELSKSAAVDQDPAESRTYLPAQSQSLASFSGTDPCSRTNSTFGLASRSSRGASPFALTGNRAGSYSSYTASPDCSLSPPPILEDDIFGSAFLTLAADMGKSCRLSRTLVPPPPSTNSSFDADHELCHTNHLQEDGNHATGLLDDFPSFGQSVSVLTDRSSSHSGDFEESTPSALTMSAVELCDNVSYSVSPKVLSLHSAAASDVGDLGIEPNMTLKVDIRQSVRDDERMPEQAGLDEIFALFDFLNSAGETRDRSHHIGETDIRSEHPSSEPELRLGEDDFGAASTLWSLGSISRGFY